MLNLVMVMVMVMAMVAIGCFLLYNTYVTAYNRDGEIVAKGFYWSKRYKREYEKCEQEEKERKEKEQREYERQETNRKIYQEIHRQNLRETRKKMEYVNDIEKDYYIKRFNDYYEQLIRKAVSKDTFIYCLEEFQTSLRKRLNRIDKNRENHELIMMFHY